MNQRGKVQKPKTRRLNYRAREKKQLQGGTTGLESVGAKSVPIQKYPILNILYSISDNGIGVFFAIVESGLVPKLLNAVQNRFNKD